MNAEFKTITPTKATALLNKSRGNRSLKDAKVASYSRDMAAGKWIENGEAIIIDESDVLIDGHHRLVACVTANVAFKSLVVSGVPSGSMKTINTGASRSISDVLAIEGVKNATHTATIVRILMSLEKGLPRSANPSTQEVFEFINKWPQISKAAEYSASHRSMPRLSALVGVIYFIEMLYGCEDDVVAFNEVLKSGVPSYDGCPAHALREKIIRNSIGHRKMSPRETQMSFVSAWDAFKEGRKVKTLRMKSNFSVAGWPKND